MAKFVLKDAEVTVGDTPVDLSEWVNACTLDTNPDLPEANVMGTFFKIRLVGLTDWSISVTFAQDFTSGAVDDTLWPLVNADPFAITIMANKTDGVSPTNPKYSGNVVLGTYQPIAGTIGDTTLVNAVFSSSGALSRATA